MELGRGVRKLRAIIQMVGICALVFNTLNRGIWESSQVAEPETNKLLRHDHCDWPRNLVPVRKWPRLAAKFSGRSQVTAIGRGALVPEP